MSKYNTFSDVSIATMGAIQDLTFYDESTTTPNLNVIHWTLW